jgi:hypothetical protein
LPSVINPSRGPVPEETNEILEQFVSACGLIGLTLADVSALAADPVAPGYSGSTTLPYMHSGVYGMNALQDSVRQMRGTAQIPGAKISVCNGVGGMVAAAGTVIFWNEP